MKISKSETHVILQAESDTDLFCQGKFAGIAPNSSLILSEGENFKLMIPEKDFTEALIKLLL
jgi:hypothetical protein